MYLAPDRTKEEQAAHSKLVNKVKVMIASAPSKFYFIRNNKINCVDKPIISPE